MTIKTATIAILLALTGVSAHAGAKAPSEETFNAVAQQGKDLGMFGFDVTVCQTTTGQVRVGGLSFWNSPLAIFLKDENGKITSTKRVSPERDEMMGVVKFDANGTSVVLDLKEPVGTSPGVGPAAMLLERPAELAIGNIETPPEQLSCFTRLSGLE